jgi:hypothetical protein
LRSFPHCHSKTGSFWPYQLGLSYYARERGRLHASTYAVSHWGSAPDPGIFKACQRSPDGRWLLLLTLQGACLRVSAGHAPWLFLATPSVASVLTIPRRVASQQGPLPFRQKFIYAAAMQLELLAIWTGVSDW